MVTSAVTVGDLAHLPSCYKTRYPDTDIDEECVQMGSNRYNTVWSRRRQRAGGILASWTSESGEKLTLIGEFRPCCATCNMSICIEDKPCNTHVCQS